ncbi:MAG: signal peptidase I [Acidimicrobiales bacterium]|jgi:signal peptidase
MTTVDLPTVRTSALRAPVLTRVERRKLARRRTRRARRSRWIHVSANVALVTMCAMTAVAATGSIAGWWRMDTVLTGSMRPGIQPGDVEILRSEPVSALRVGQIVAFHPPRDSFTVTHRVIALRKTSGGDAGPWITTKGDANDVSDPWGSVQVLGRSVWVVTGVVPDIGFLTVWMRSPLPHLFLLLTIVLVICIIAVEMVWRT